MELKPISGSPDEALVRFDTELEDDLFNPNLYRSAARRVLERMHIVQPREYPYTEVFSMGALNRREAVVHANNCPYRHDFSPAVQGVRRQLHDMVLDFGAQLREVEQANWPDYER